MGLTGPGETGPGEVAFQRGPQRCARLYGDKRISYGLGLSQTNRNEAYKIPSLFCGSGNKCIFPARRVKINLRGSPRKPRKFILRGKDKSTRLAALTVVRLFLWENLCYNVNRFYNQNIETKMLSTASVGQISQLAHNFNWHSPSWDLFIFVAWVIVAVVYAFAAGRGRVINVLICSYIAKLIVLQVPSLGSTVAQHLNSNSFLLPLQQMATFLIIFLILFWLLGRYVFRTAADSHEISSMFFGLIFSFLQIGLLISILLSYLPLTTQSGFSQLIQILFIKNPAGLIWLILPLIYLVVLGKFLSEDDAI
jgi:hypothetical protein